MHVHMRIASLSMEVEGDALADTPLGRQRVPRFLAEPSSSLEERFARFHRENPSLYREFERRALALYHAGATRVGIAMIAEAIRYDDAVARRGAYKVNNSYRAFYSRMLLHDHPELSSLIETRGRES
jgi:hypothetical protein